MVFFAVVLSLTVFVVVFRLVFFVVSGFLAIAALPTKFEQLADRILMIDQTQTHGISLHRAVSVMKHKSLVKYKGLLQ